MVGTEEGEFLRKVVQPVERAIVGLMFPES